MRTSALKNFSQINQKFVYKNCKQFGNRNKAEVQTFSVSSFVKIKQKNTTTGSNRTCAFFKFSPLELHYFDRFYIYLFADTNVLLQI